MKLRIKALRLFILFFMVSPCVPGLQYTTLHAAPQTTNAQLVQEQETTLLGLFDELNTHFNTIQKTWQNIVDQINSGYLKSAGNTTEVITDIKRFINKIKGEITKEKRKIKETELTEDSILDALQTIVVMNKITTQLKTHIEQQIASGLQKLKPFEIDDRIFTRAIQIDELHIDHLRTTIARNKTSLTQLSETSKTVGLSWLQKQCRKTEPLVKMWQDYVPTEKIVLGSLGLGWAWYRFCAKDETKNSYGWPLQTINYLPDASYHADHSLGYFGKLEAGALMAVFSQSPIAGYFLDKTAPTAERHRWYAKWKKWCWDFYRKRCGRQVKGDTGDNLDEINPRFTFDDLVGLEHQKQRIQEILHYIEDPEGHDLIGVRPRTGYMLAGPPRTGKTMFCEAFAGEMKRIAGKQDNKEIKFFPVSIRLIKTIGMNEIMFRAKRLAPCILFIDDFDLLNLKREADATLLSECLNVMSGCRLDNADELVIFMATTNKQEHVDYALRDAGRFEIVLPFELPTIAERRSFFEKSLKKLAVPLESIDIEQLALETDRCNYAQLNTIMQVAHLKATMQDSAITQEILQKVFDEEVRKVIPTDHKRFPQEERELIAMHQAGHALAVLLNNTKQTLAKVTIGAMVADVNEEAVMQRYWCAEQKDIKYGETFTYRIADHLSNMETYQDKLNDIKYLLAGHLAEELLLSDRGLQCGYIYHKHDQQHALMIARDLVLKGISFEQLPENMQNDIWQKAQKLINECKEQVTELLTKHKEELRTVVDTLLEKTTLSAREIKVIMGMEKAPALPTGAQELTTLKDLVHDANATA